MSRRRKAAATTRSFDKIAAWLAGGQNVLIFPEGTSHSEPHLIDVKSGAAVDRYYDLLTLEGLDDGQLALGDAHDASGVRRLAGHLESALDGALKREQLARTAPRLDRFRLQSSMENLD